MKNLKLLFRKYSLECVISIKDQQISFYLITSKLEVVLNIKNLLDF